MMKNILIFFVIFTLEPFSLFAGTPGNDDVSIIYGLVIGFLALILGIDYLIRFVKKRKFKRQLELNNEEIL